MNPAKKRVRIVSTGSYLPEKVLTNADLAKLVDTSDEWIATRTGIRERHIAAEARPPSTSLTTPRCVRWKPPAWRPARST